MDLQTWRAEWGFVCDPLVVERLRELGMDDDMIAAVIEIVDDTCPHCWDNHRGCHCWDDE